ncbi:MAG TPA: M56 family metallopeptidase, partial [Candidatus Acidoferrum sp.]|nr:M56 family metallopeptidase [Candidatus Acidoferrum sp.]
RALGWALLHFVWQGMALAAFAGVAMAITRRTQTRYLIGIVTLAAMLLAPAATFIVYLQQNSYSPRHSQSSPVLAPARTRSSAVPAVHPSAAGSAVAPALDSLPWLVEAWLIGVAFFSLRSAGGFLLLERERRRQSSVVSERLLEMCYSLQDQLGIRRAIQYCECTWLQAPAVIGWFRPIVFLPVSALTGLSEEQLRAVIAHELAHIKRFDPFVNVFQVSVETLLFYHPAVWWLNKRIRAEREHCCDEAAVAMCGNAVEYARALTLMEEWRSAPTFAMAANRGPVTERILRVLGMKSLGSGMRAAGMMGSIVCLTAALLAGNAFVGIAHSHVATVFPDWQIAARAASPTPSQAPSAKSTSAPKPSPAVHPQSAPSASANSYIDGLKSAGLENLTVDELIALKTQDVTPEYVRGLQEQGLHPDANALVAMRVQDITPEYVRDIRAAGLSPTQDQLIALRVQGADAAYYRGMKEAGINPDLDRLIALKVQGATPEYVRELRAAGFAVSADQVIAMKVQDITPGYVKALHDLGLQPNADNLIGMKVQDVTSEWVREIQALGFKPSVDQLIGMRVQDVTPEYIKALQAAGFNPSVNEIISAKVQDVTPGFLERAKQHGFKDLTIEKLIRLRELGILDSKADL